MIKYYTSTSTWKISKQEIDKETNTYVFQGGIRTSKISAYSGFFNSFDEAKKFLLEYAEAEARLNEKRALRSWEQYEKALELKE